MKKILILVCLALVIALTGFVAAKKITIRWVANAQIAAVPFTAEIHVFTNMDKTSGGELFRTKVIARSGNGSTMEAGSVGNVASGQTAKRVTFPNGTRVNVFDLIGGRTTWKLNEGNLASIKQRLMTPPADCLFGIEGEKYLRRETLWGQDAAVIEASSPDGRTIAWRIQKLGCEELQYRWEPKQTDGSYKALTEARLIALQLAEPDARLFDPRSDYAELRPSQAYRLYKEKFGVSLSDQEKVMLQRQDLRYQAH